MAQTITIQRGKVTLTSGSTTLLFTNGATGTASRLITGHLTISSTNLIQPAIGFAVLPSGLSSPDYSVFAGTIASAAARLFSATPHDAGGQFYNTTSNFAVQPTFYNDTLNIQVIRSMATTTASAIPTRFYYNTNVMIGPSDAIYVGYTDISAANSANVIYNFVIITES